jgi:hypothetical protein
LKDHEHFVAEAMPLAGEAVLNFDSSGLVAKFVLLDGGTMLRNKYATLSNQQRKPSFKFGASDEFGSVILLLSNKDVQLAGSQSLTQGQMIHVSSQKRMEPRPASRSSPPLLARSLLHEWGEYAAKAECARHFR